MQDVRIDRDGQLRCWNCGATHMARRRTGTFWATVIIGGILTIGILALIALVFVKPKLQCHVCNEWNRPGQAHPYTGPARAQQPADVPHLAPPNPTTQARTSGEHLPRRRTEN